MLFFKGEFSSPTSTRLLNNQKSVTQRELAMENDFLKTDAQNREDLALVKAPLADLPDEVIDKVDALHVDED